MAHHSKDSVWSFQREGSSPVPPRLQETLCVVLCVWLCLLHCIFFDHSGSTHLQAGELLMAPHSRSLWVGIVWDEKQERLGLMQIHTQGQRKPLRKTPPDGARSWWVADLPSSSGLTYIPWCGWTAFCLSSHPTTHASLGCVHSLAPVTPYEKVSV